MSNRKSEREIEERSLKDLREILKDTKDWGLKIVVIGGYAVRAYTVGYRYTKDIDMIVNKEERGRFTGLLNGLKYKVKKTKFGITGTKKIDGGDIKLHISIGQVYDESTGNTYPVTDDTFKKSKTLEVSGFYERRSLKFMVLVVSIEELIILKLMMKAREKDVVDLIGLFKDKMEEINVKTFADSCRSARVDEHISSQILNFIGIIRKGDAARYWFKLTGSRLDTKTQTRTLGFI